MDIINIEVLEDGTIKFETTEISGVNHKSADDFLAMIEDLTAKRKTTPKKKSHSMNLRSHDRKVTNKY